MNKYELKGTETEILVVAPGRDLPAWVKVHSFCWHADESELYPAELVGVYVAGQGLRRKHVVLNGR